MKCLLKSLLPASVWQILATTYHFVESIVDKVRRPYRIRKWKRQLRVQRSGVGPSGIEVRDLENRLPNSRGIAIDTGALDLKEIIQVGYSNAERRRSGVAGFDGLALDDALGWIEEYRHYSFVPLARAVSEIANAHFQTPGFTVLELGCGWGGFRVLLQAFGATAYLGIDANPIPFSHSPFMLEAPANYRLLNLQEKIDFGTKFDVVCSFEVLEHIREDRMDCILQTISTHLSPRSLFIGTAALTDYTDVHVTVHPRQWWVERFREHRMVSVCPDSVCPDKEARWLKLLARMHPFNWNASTTSMFVLHKRESGEHEMAGLG